MGNPDPQHMIDFCQRQLPRILTQACQVDDDLAHRIGADVLARAEAFAALPERDQDVLIAPFVEEVFDHEPHEVSLELKAAVTVVVRNSLLEQAHHDGPLGSGIITITRLAAGPLSHLLAARRREPLALHDPDPFTGLPIRYPRAWAALDALTHVIADGGRFPLTLPTAPVPALPGDDEITEAPAASHDRNIAVLSAINPHFDQRLLDLMHQARDGNFIACTSALSRYSRNSDKLHRVLEYLLAHQATILTTNYLIRPTEVWVRRGTLIKPDSHDPYAAITNPRGLSGAHRKITAALAEHMNA